MKNASLLLVLVLAVIATVYGQAGICLSTTSTVNVRSSPCQGVVASLPAGTLVRTTGSAVSTSCLGVTGWVPITSIASGVSGWVASTYTRPSTSCSSTVPPPSGGSGRTVQDAVSAGGCETSVVRGLSFQLVQQINCLAPGTLIPIDSLQPVSFSSSVTKYLQQNAYNDLQRAISRRGVTMQINSALRTLAQQQLLYSWFKRGQCGITAAAVPGTSNHESGTAVDISNADSWISAMSANDWRKLGSFDPPHYDYVGSSTNLRSLSVRAFQRLWNQNKTNKLTEDGVYGPGTENALLQSPIDGFSVSRC